LSETKRKEEEKKMRRSACRMMKKYQMLFMHSNRLFDRRFY